MDLDTSNLRRVAVASGVVVTALQAATATLALRAGRRDYADGVWGPGLAAVALTSAVVGRGDPRRRWALAAVTTAWAARLETLMLGRLRGSDEEDERYTEFLEGDSTPVVLAKVFGTQAVAQLLVSAPLQVAAASRLPRGPRRWLFPAGVAVMVAGAVVEAVADRQKAAYAAEKAKAREAGQDDDVPADLEVLDSGLWGWSRHPNYFGDSVVWDGAWLAAAASSPGVWTLPAPVAMSYFLIYATGAKRTEDKMGERPAYQDYQRRVAFFFPRPPR
jgi:steroid 5-alpha reductase family enzyme